MSTLPSRPSQGKPSIRVSRPHTAVDGAVSHLRDYVGRQALLIMGNLLVPVQCVDARQVFRRIDVLVTPVGGDGEQWVAADRLRYE